MRTPRLLLLLPFIACCRGSSKSSAPPQTSAAPQVASAPAQHSGALSPSPPGATTASTGAAHPGQTVAFGNGASGYLALPPAPGGPGAPAGAAAAGATSARRPAVLVIQEWWGLNDWIRSNADRFASQGYVALAVDLYRGRTASSPDEAHELMRGLPEDRGLGDIKAGFDLLAARADVDPQRVGIVGWCMGGGYALDFATIEPRLRAAVVNYGHLFSDAKKIDSIHAALLGNFGGQDRGIPAADVRSFADSLKAKGKDVDFKVYEPDGHAFMNPNNAHGYDAAAASNAWERIDAFFARTLKSKT